VGMLGDGVATRGETPVVGRSVLRWHTYHKDWWLFFLVERAFWQC
jgi:hypothetical protein